MKKLFALLLLVGYVSSCTLNQHFHFNEDYSGSYTMSFDMSSIMEMAMAEDSTASEEDMWAEMPFDSLKTVYEGMEGISNVQVKGEGGVLTMSYDYANIESLNKVLENSDMGGDEEDEMFGMLLGNSTYFEAKGNKLSYNVPDMADMGIADSLSMYMEMVSYTTEFTFEKDVKKVSNENAVVSDKKITLEGNFGELLKGEKEMSFEAKLK